MLEVVGSAYASAGTSFGITIPTDILPGDLLLLWMGVPTTTDPAPPSDDGSFFPLALAPDYGYNGEFYATFGGEGVPGYSNVRARLRYRFATESDAGRQVALDQVHPAHTSGPDLYGWAELVVLRGVNPTGDDPASYTHPWVLMYDSGWGSGSVLDGHWIANTGWLTGLETQRVKPFFFYIGANWYGSSGATPYPSAPTLQKADFGPPFVWLPDESFDLPAALSALIVNFIGDGLTTYLEVFTGPTFGADSPDNIELPVLQVAGSIEGGQFAGYAGLLLFIHDAEPTPDLAAGPLTSRVIFE